ncbi:uncharacterized protein BP5553_09327 [Venustampulla echinocandica]|uniref:Uncharacterized protein n=1 Tax=Venustampulla echinocandica TaxID=2656787 RepID=A0A370TCG3_9HELO|nr:uncharacterized protein BP5553_09327 [Venustampulla echinocandica]RDL31925.1 hypothetical protein BP5553_09327 [Venustampulla echinocandica]
MNLLDRIQQKLELFRLEQRYTRRRTTFISEAQYVDGEYIYSPSSTYSAKCSAGSSDSDEDIGSKRSRKESRRESSKENSKGSSKGSSKESSKGNGKESSPENSKENSNESNKESSPDTKPSKRLSRLMLNTSDWRKSARDEKRQSRMSVREVKWNDQVR